METIQFISYPPQQLQGEINSSVKKRLKNQNVKRQNERFKKGQETVKIFNLILKTYCNLEHLSQLMEPNLLHNYHQEILSFLCFAKNIFVKWLL